MTTKPNPPPDLSVAKQRLVQLDEAILAASPKEQEDFRTVQERIRFLQARYPVMAKFAILRASLEDMIKRGK